MTGSSAITNWVFATKWRKRAFAYGNRRIFFMGHFHQWAIYDTESQLDWDGKSPIMLEPNKRYLVVINGVVNKACATFETRSGLLTPFSQDEY